MSQTLPLVGATLDPFEPGLTVGSATSTDYEGDKRPIPSLDHEGPNIFLSAEPAVDVSIVLPYYNPGVRLRTTVENVLRVLTDSDMSFEVIAVSDGSTDASPSTIDDFPEHLVKRVSLARNAGKGYALRTGFGMAQGRYVGFIDADGDISPDYLASFLSVMEAQEPDIVIGSKRHPDSSAENKTVRQLYSWGHQHFVHLLFRLDVKDTQVGIKLADRRLMVDVLPLLRERRFSFDLELLVLARRLGYTNVVEAPVHIEERSGSTVSFKVVRRMLFDTIGIFWRSTVRHVYDVGPTMRAFSRPVVTDACEVVEPERAVA
jgi:glycosyltransferase involved in cell wall biosynthesis